MMTRLATSSPRCTIFMSHRHSIPRENSSSQGAVGIILNATTWRHLHLSTALLPLISRWCGRSERVDHQGISRSARSHIAILRQHLICCNKHTKLAFLIRPEKKILASPQPFLTQLYCHICQTKFVKKFFGNSSNKMVASPQMPTSNSLTRS